jgi:hypothetical protein
MAKPAKKKEKKQTPAKKNDTIKVNTTFENLLKIAATTPKKKPTN